MITISKKVEYSIILISYLAKREGETVSLMDVSKKLLLPYRFLGQLAAALKEANIVESKEGKNGGYCLNKNWKKKSLYDLLDALGENKHMVRCLETGHICAREANCQLRGVWDKMEKSFIKELKLIKLSEI
jgi:Rrf2 family protein